MAKIHWVLPDIKDAKPTSVHFSDSDKVDMFLEKAVKECDQLTSHVYVDITFEDKVLSKRDHVVKYKTSLENPFKLEMSKELVNKLKAMTIEQLNELDSKVVEWKPNREKSLIALEKLAVDADATFTYYNRVKFIGAGVSALATIGGLIAVGVTGGLATPIVVGGFAAAVGSTVTVGVADWMNSQCSSEARKECQEILDNEKQSYKNVRECLGNLQDDLEKLCIESGWPAQEALAAVLSSAMPSVTVDGRVTGTGKAGARIVLEIWTATGLVADYYEIVDAAVDAIDGARKTVEGARKVAQAARDLNLDDVVRATEAAAEAAEAAAQGTKTFKTTKQAAAAIENAIQVSDDVAKIVANNADTVNKAAKTGWGFFKSVHPAGKIATEGAEIAAKGAQAVSKAGRIAAKAGRFFAKAVPFLNIIGLLMDFNDMWQSGGSALGYESGVGKYIREEAKKMEDQMAFIENKVIPKLDELRQEKQ